MTGLKAWVDPWQDLSQKTADSIELLELAEAEGDKEVLASLKKDAVAIEQGLQKLEIRKMFDGPDDDKPAVFSIHPGAGGTESQDWAGMLMRMYARWFESRGFSFDIVDLLDGEEAGIKSVTFEVSGENAFGFCSAEIGVHRLVRISPFDAAKRRHTSFASAAAASRFFSSSSRKY